LRITLVNPPVWQWTGFQMNFNPPLGILYLASVLRAEHEVRILDFEALRLNLKESLNKILEGRPDTVGITSTSIGFPSLCWLSQRLRKAGKRVIIGGPHVTWLGSKSLEKSKAITAVIGEGESVTA